MKIRYLTTDYDNFHFNISDYSSKIEIVQKINDLFNSSFNDDELNFIYKPPIKGSISNPVVIKVYSPEIG